MVKAGFGRRMAREPQARVANQALISPRSTALCNHAGSRRGLERHARPAFAPKAAAFPRAGSCKQLTTPFS